MARPAAEQTADHLFKAGETWLELEPHISDDSGSGDFKGRQEFDCIAIDGEIVIYGGKNGTSLLNDIWFVPNF